MGWSSLIRSRSRRREDPDLDPKIKIRDSRSPIINIMNRSACRVAALGLPLACLLILRLPGGAHAGCTATTEKSCAGGCEWNFVASCCYEKGEANCAVSTSYIATKPEIDTSTKVGIDTPGSEASVTLKEVPLEPVAPPAFGSTSMGGQSNMVAGGGLTNGMLGGQLPGSRRRRRLR